MLTQFDHLERAGREELIRKYLAAKSHFGTMRGGGDKGEGGRKEGERTGGWRGKMAAQMREERMREWEREASTVSNTSSYYAHLIIVVLCMYVAA